MAGLTLLHVDHAELDGGKQVLKGVFDKVVALTTVVLLSPLFAFVMLAIKLDTKYSKAQILQMYAEVAYYGSNYYGLQAASCGYFGVQPSQLSWPEAAFLAGVVNAPTLDNPRTNPENARNRETHVVERLVAVKVLTAAQAKTVLAQHLNVVPVGTGC